MRDMEMEGWDFPSGILPLGQYLGSEDLLVFLF